LPDLVILVKAYRYISVHEVSDGKQRNYQPEIFSDGFINWKRFSTVLRFIYFAGFSSFELIFAVQILKLKLI
jgi:hypothetical protein